MPGNQGRRCSEPANNRVSQEFSELLEGRPVNRRTEDALLDPRREAEEERPQGVAEQNHCRSDGHEEQVLGHVGGKELMVESGKGRNCGEAEQRKTGEKARAAPGGDAEGLLETKLAASAKVKDGGKENEQRNRDEKSGEA